jgi:hypothetical protein
VARAEVTAREDFAGDRRLAGYLVPAGYADTSGLAAAEHAAARLPEYLVPSAFVVHVQETGLSLSRESDWQPGDVLLIDNVAVARAPPVYRLPPDPGGDVRTSTSAGRRALCAAAYLGHLVPDAEHRPP